MTQSSSPEIETIPHLSHLKALSLRESCLKCHWVSDEEIMDDILTDGSKSKAVDSCDENGLGKMKKDRRETEPGLQHGRSSCWLWSQSSTTAQTHRGAGSNASLGDRAKGPPRRWKFI